MSRPRTPTKVLKIRGSFTAHPERKKAREGEPEITAPLGDPPESFDEAQKARWGELATWCPWLTIVDRPSVEIVCRLWMKMRANEAKTADYGVLMNCLSRLGMTPVDRSKVKMPNAKDDKKSLLA